MLKRYVKGDLNRKLNEMDKEYNPIYPEYVEEVKPSNESPNNNKMARTISLEKSFHTQTYPSRSQVYYNTLL